MMSKKNYKIFGNFLLIGVLILISCSLVSAIGVGSPYSVEIPLEMYPSQEMIFYLNLENPDAELGEVSLSGEILEGSEIASLLEEGPHKVLFGEATRVRMEVKVPASANVGDEYLIRYKFSQVDDGRETEGVTFRQSIERVMKVVVVPKPAEPIAPVVEESRTGASAVWLWVVVIVVIILIVWWIIMARKKKAGEGMPQKGK